MPHYRVGKVPAHRMAAPSRDGWGKGSLAQNRPHCQSRPFAPVPPGTRELVQTVSTRWGKFLFFLILLLLTSVKLWRRSYVVNSSSSFPAKKHLTNSLLQIKDVSEPSFPAFSIGQKLNLAPLSFLRHAVTHRSQTRKFLLAHLSTPSAYQLVKS